jgi:hypothetical protein
VTTSGKVSVVLGVGLFLLWWLRPKGTVTTAIEGFELLPSDYPEGLKETARAIARAEGFYVPDSIPQRAHNPGNLKAGGETLGGTGITVFPDDDAGWSALYKQLARIVEGRSAYYTLDTTIRAMGQRWTATTSEQFAWATNVASALNVSVDAPLSQVLL